MQMLAIVVVDIAVARREKWRMVGGARGFKGRVVSEDEEELQLEGAEEVDVETEIKGAEGEAVHRGDSVIVHLVIIVGESRLRGKKGAVSALYTSLRL